MCMYVPGPSSMGGKDEVLDDFLPLRLGGVGVRVSMGVGVTMTRGT